MGQLLSERRTSQDRRQRPTRPFSRHMFSGRRHTIRRKTDRKTHLYVDRYGHWLFLSLLLIVLFSVLDAYFTIFLIDRGAEEMNPFTAFLLGQGFMYFFWVKYALTTFAVLVLCIYKNHFFVRIAIPSALIVYLSILSHHLVWFFMV